MRNIILKPWTKVCAAVALAFLASHSQAQTVTTIGGGYITAPFQGFQDGHTLQARFNQPSGLAMDPADNYLFVADYSNNVVRVISTPGVTASSTTTSFTNSFNTNITRGVSHPISVIVDGATNVFVLNRGNITNGTLIEYNALFIGYPSFVTTNASGLTNATAMAFDQTANIYITTASNTVLRVSLPNTVSVVGTVTSPGARLQGIAVLDNGQLALSDAGTNSGIWMMNPTNGTVVPLAGFNGTGDNVDNWPVPAEFAIFNHPGNIAKAGNNILVIADQGNNRVKLLDMISGSVDLLYGVNSNYWGNPATTTDKYPGWLDGTSGTQSGYAESRLPYGLVVASDGSVFASEDYYHVLRHVTSTGLVGPPAPPPPPPGAPQNLTAIATYGKVSLTWTAVTGVTNYNVKHSPSSGGPYSVIGTVSTTSFTDGEPNGSTNYYVVSAIGAGGEGPNSAQVMAVVPVPPPPAPRIGWFDYELIGLVIETVLHPVAKATFNNDQLLAIDPVTNGVSTYYTTDGTDPSNTNGFTPPFYQDFSLSSMVPLPATTVPQLIIKAVNIDSLGQTSAISTAEFDFQVANPTILGNNAAQFQVSDITSNSVLYYTLDGSDPTNGPPSVGPISLNATNATQISLIITSNTLFRIRGFRSGYAPSGIAQEIFSPSNFVANTISFGFTSGEASSAFIASPGQTFYAPITLSTLPGAEMYSLQFNVVVTNAGPNPGPAISPGAFNFQSRLMKPDPALGQGIYVPIMPYMFIGDETNPVNPSQIVNYEGTNFVNLMTTDTALNLLTVGWLERFTETNLYVTGSQDLIQYSLAHDDMFLQSGGKIIVGGYSFQVPASAASNQTYQIQINRPTATSDGIGAPGSDVYLSAPTNGSTASGAPLNALKYVTVGQIKYIAGSVYPFRWFNAGDFGSSNIVNADVEQVFQSAIYFLNEPLANSDFFDGMDSCGNIGVVDNDPTDANNGFYTNSLTAASTTALFSGDDTTINQIAFGDGQLDVCDVYVTFRRSLDPSLTWFRRFWNGGQRVADTGAPNVANHGLKAPAPKPLGLNTSATAPQVNFVAGDVIGSAGQTVQIPINATVLGNYPLRVLMLNLSVVPLDGSPALTSQVTLNQTAAVLGTPYTTTSDGNGNFAAVWLNSTNTGLTGTATIGTLSVTIPSTASGTAAYAVHFDHASASPNGIASFTNQKLTGLLTTTARTNSTYGDGIPDSWRLRWFGTVDNILSVSNACPSGDGVSNWQKFVAGVDPNAANDFPSLNSKSPVPSGSTTAIHWPSVAGKQYVILRATTLFGTPWTTLSTNTGTGGDMEFDDNATSNTKFYRVQILP